MSSFYNKESERGALTFGMSFGAIIASVFSHWFGWKAVAAFAVVTALSAAKHLYRAAGVWHANRAP